MQVTAASEEVQEFILVFSSCRSYLNCLYCCPPADQETGKACIWGCIHGTDDRALEKANDLGSCLSSHCKEACGNTGSADACADCRGRYCFGEDDACDWNPSGDWTCAQVRECRSRCPALPPDNAGTRERCLSDPGNLCRQQCYGQGSPEAMELHDAWWACAASQGCQGPCFDSFDKNACNACMEERCRREHHACLGIVDPPCDSRNECETNLDCPSGTHCVPADLGECGTWLRCVSTGGCEPWPSSDCGEIGPADRCGYNSSCGGMWCGLGPDGCGGNLRKSCGCPRYVCGARCTEGNLKYCPPGTICLNNWECAPAACMEKGCDRCVFDYDCNLLACEHIPQLGEPCLDGGKCYYGYECWKGKCMPPECQGCDECILDVMGNVLSCTKQKTATDCAEVQFVSANPAGYCGTGDVSFATI